MKTFANLEPLLETISKSKKAILLMGPNPNIDTAASALALSLVLKKKEIDVQVASPADMRVEFSRLVGVDEVKKKIANRNLVVSFPYSEEKVEKVSYNISEDGKTFNLVIAPKSNAKPLDPAEVRYDYAGAEADLVILVGVSSFEELGEIYQNDRNTLESATTVALTLFPVATYANHHFDAQGLSSLCELTTALIVQAQLPIDADSASNLLFGVESVTNGFAAPTVTADTFETIALLLRSGAKRQPVGQHGTLSSTQMPWQAPPVSQPTTTPATSGDGQPAGTNPFAAALSQNAQKSSIMPAGYSATGELKG